MAPRPGNVDHLAGIALHDSLISSIGVAWLQTHSCILLRSIDGLRHRGPFPCELRAGSQISERPWPARCSVQDGVPRAGVLPMPEAPHRSPPPGPASVPTAAGTCRGGTSCLYPLTPRSGFFSLLGRAALRVVSDASEPLAAEAPSARSRDAWWRMHRSFQARCRGPRLEPTGA